MKSTYGFEDRSGRQLAVAVRQARALITLAESTVAR